MIFIIKCEICGNEYKKRYFKSFKLEIRELWGLHQKVIDPIKLKVCSNCGQDGEKVLEQFKIRLSNVKKTRELI